MHANVAYEELVRRSRETSLLASCSSLLGWDEQTYMPKGGVEHRSQQMALLAGMHHEKATDPAIGDLLTELEQSPLVVDADSPPAVNIRELRRTFNRAVLLPRSLVEELARATSVAQQEWIVARREQNFARFQPWLETIVGLKRQEAECIGFEDDPYDALLDEYEPGAKTQEIAAVFKALRADLVPLVDAIAGSSRRPNLTILHRNYPIDRQRIFGEVVASAVGFDFKSGRLDVAAHPFCSGIGPGDCRVTTRFDVNNFSDSLFGILHEVGHGMYDQGLAPEHHGTPMGDAASLGVHESQSRLWENAVGRSRAFWEHFFPLAGRVFFESLQDVALDDFHFAINHVERSLIRVQADEVTYNLHILIRLDLERDLLSGNLAVADVPGAWNEKYRTDLGVEPKNAAEGCLQDIHWSAGLFGYFPTYALGNMLAAQLFQRADQALGGLEQRFARGEFRPLLDWLRDKVHRHGHRYRLPALVQHVTGAPLDHRPLIANLRRKYGELYGFTA